VPKFAIDTNVYISAFRDAARAAELKQFLMASLSRTSLLAVVAQELRAGVRTAAQLDAFAEVTGPFERRGRLIAPSAHAYLEAGRILADLATKDLQRLRDLPPSFINDVMIAVSCRENGITLITSNAKDFTTITRHLKSFAFEAPWPSSPRRKTRPR
jgi:predicted nucleic acid-binding protein